MLQPSHQPGHKMYFSNNKTWKSKLLLKLQNGSYVNRHKNHINLLHFHQSSWVTKYIVSEQEYFERSLFFSAAGLNSGLKIFKPCCTQMCCHPGFVVPFIEHRQSRISIIINGPRIFWMVSEHWLQLRHQLHQPLTRESACLLKLWSKAWSFPLQLWKS